MKTRFSIFLFFYFSIFNSVYLHAQNLVLNPSFENYINCPGSNSGAEYVQTNVLNWQNTLSNLYYFNACAPSNTDYSAPENGYGFQIPKTGNAYASLIGHHHRDLWGNYSLIPNIRSYLQGGFSSTLIKDSIYCVSYYVNRVNQTPSTSFFAIQNIDAHISDTLLTWNNGVGYDAIGKVLLGITPQIKSKHIITDTANWVLISNLYKAHGGEQHLTIGNFLTDEQTTFITTDHNIAGVVYYIDDVSVLPTSLTAPKLGKDTLLCRNTLPYTLTAPAGYDSILWSNGSTGNTLQVTTAGTYWVKCTATGCGELYDTVKISIRNTPTLNLPSTITVCLGDSLALTAQAGFSSYTWNTNQTTPSIYVSNAGNYKIKTTTVCGTQTDSTHVLLDSLPTFALSLGKDTTLCTLNNVNQPITLSTSHTMPHYAWSTGATTPTITVNEAGVYVLNGHYYCGTKTANIHVDDCLQGVPYSFYIPNAFTPNADKLNEVFAPKYYNITIDDFKIYTRRGNCVYELSNNPKGWDGMYKDLQCPTGEYVYKLLYTINATQQVVQKVGKVALLRD
ncbi:MAG: gliding motility-associated C-terminal domain-containing protein [Bacteroidia bacterium]